MWSCRAVFVPKVRRDGSDSTELAEVLTVYCLECVQERTRPVGYGLIGSEGTFCNLEP